MIEFRAHFLDFFHLPRFPFQTIQNLLGFYNNGYPHAAPPANGDRSKLFPVRMHRMEESGHKPHPAEACRMSKGNCPSMDVYFIPVPFKNPLICKNLSGE